MKILFLNRTKFNIFKETNIIGLDYVKTYCTNIGAAIL